MAQYQHDLPGTTLPLVLTINQSLFLVHNVLVELFQTGEYSLLSQGFKVVVFIK